MLARAPDRPRRRPLLSLLAGPIGLCALVLAPASNRNVANAQTDAADDGNDARRLPTVRFKHKGCGPEGSECRLAYGLDLADGKQFLIVIDSTLPADFRYNIAGIVAAPTEAAAFQAEEYRDTSFVQTHDKRFGGYVVTIRRKGETAALPEATLIISVRTSEWQAAVAGGFPVSTLTDRVYALRDTTVGETTRYLVERKKDHENDVSLSTATFVHLRRSDWRIDRWRTDVGLSFGLGIGGSTAYYIGPSVLFGNAGAFTLGAVFGSRSELPAGVSENELTSNANALASLIQRNAAGLFISLSYSFIGGASDLEKPFKGADPAAPAQDGGTTGRSPSPAPAEGPGAVSLTPGSPKVGEEVILSITLHRPQGAEALVDGSYEIVPATSADSALFSLTSGQVELKATGGGARAQGAARAKMLKEATDAELSVRVSGNGLDGVALKSAPVTIAPGQR